MIITISNKDLKYYDEPTFTMTVDVAELCRSAGKRERNPDYYYNGSGGRTWVPYPLPRAKKLLKLIYKYAEDSDAVRVHEYLKEHNKKLYDYWMKLAK